MRRAARSPGATVRYYWRGGADGCCDLPALPAGFELRIWRPAKDGLPPPGPFADQNLVWLGLDRLGLLASHGFEELSVWRGELILHRLIVSPRWFRFPFMPLGDLQIGGLWTASVARRMGLARAAIAQAHHRHGAAGRGFWYVVDGENGASIGLAEACGYRLVGTGRRTRPLGLSLLGQFRLDRRAAPIAG